MQNQVRTNGLITLTTKYKGWASLLLRPLVQPTCQQYNRVFFVLLRPYVYGKVCEKYWTGGYEKVVSGAN